MHTKGLLPYTDRVICYGKSHFSGLFLSTKPVLMTPFPEARTQDKCVLTGQMETFHGNNNAAERSFTTKGQLLRSIRVKPSYSPVPSDFQTASLTGLSANGPAVELDTPIDFHERLVWPIRFSSSEIGPRTNASGYCRTLTIVQNLDR